MGKKAFKIEEFSKLYKTVKLPIVDSDEYLYSAFSNEEVKEIIYHEHFSNINKGKLPHAIKATLTGMLNLKSIIIEEANQKDLDTVYLALRTAVMNIK